jgi:hypothetical protein
MAGCNSALFLMIVQYRNPNIDVPVHQPDASSRGPSYYQNTLKLILSNVLLLFAKERRTFWDDYRRLDNGLLNLLHAETSITHIREVSGIADYDFSITIDNYNSKCHHSTH